MVISRVLKRLTLLSVGIARMESESEDYDIFDDWEIDEIRLLLGDAIKIVQYVEAMEKEKAL